MRMLLLTPLLCLCLCAAAQDAHVVPELRAALKAAPNDTARADAMARLCFNLIRSAPDSARHYGERALALARRIGNQRAIGDAHNNLGWLDAETGQLDSADRHLDRALAIFRRSGQPEHIAVTLSNKGWVSEKRGDQVGALQYFLDALEHSEQARDSSSTAVLLYSIGVAYRKTGAYQQALQFLERSMSLERKLRRRSNEANCVVALANTFREMDDTLHALEGLRTAAFMYTELKDHKGLGIAAENLGELLSPRDPVAALHAFQLALAHYDTAHSPVDQAYALRNLGDHYLGMGRLSEAEQALQTGAALAATSGDGELRMNYAYSLASLARTHGDANTVFAQLERHIALKDSLQGSSTQHELARLRTAFDSERKENDNVLLRAINGEQAAHIRSSRLKFQASLVVATLVLLAALLLLRNYLQKKKYAAKLEGLNQRLAASNTEISGVNDLLEMKLLRSQMNPHFIYNCLNSAAHMTQKGNQVEALAYLQGFARLLRMVLDHSVNDRIRITDEIDFLGQYLKLETSRLQDLTYTVEANPNLIDEDAEIAALIVQPFVENAVWHGLAEKAGPKHIGVQFGSNGTGIDCIITDNGIGRTNAAKARMAPENHHTSLGMQLTSERLRLLSRRLKEETTIHVEDLVDAQGLPEGTRITLHLS